MYHGTPVKYQTFSGKTNCSGFKVIKCQKGMQIHAYILSKELNQILSSN